MLDRMMLFDDVNCLDNTRLNQLWENWRDVPLETHEIVVNLIGSTRTTEGLEVHAWLDERDYPKGLKVSDAELEEVCIRRNRFQGD